MPGGETNDYLDVNGWLYHDTDNEMSYWGNIVHGEQTPFSMIPATGSASYRGDIRGDMWESAGSVVGGMWTAASIRVPPLKSIGIPPASRTGF